MSASLLNRDFKDRRKSRAPKVRPLSADWQAEADRRLLLEFRQRVAANVDSRRIAALSALPFAGAEWPRLKLADMTLDPLEFVNSLLVRQAQ